ncbi:MAG: hypothetical protein Q8P67_27960 [archaeon]|nr:hypothetical protein [archaeon]
MSDTRLESLAQHLAAFEEQSAVEHAQNRILIQQATRRAVLNDKVLLALRLDASSTAFQLAQAARRSVRLFILVFAL